MTATFRESIGNPKFGNERLKPKGIVDLHLLHKGLGWNQPEADFALSDRAVLTTAHWLGSEGYAPAQPYSRLISPMPPTVKSLAHARQRALFIRKYPRPAKPAKPENSSKAKMADEEVVSHMAGGSVHKLPIDPLYTREPPIIDDLITVTSNAQDGTIDSCLPLLKAQDDSIEYNIHGVPRLRRQRIINFLRHTLGQLPAPFVMADASRPWSLYWALNGMSLLGADVSGYRDGLIATAQHLQNDSGGFGGGFGQLSHLATTYAMVLALAIVGGEDAYEVIDRRAMWKWLSFLKQPDGGFSMSLGGEVDVRGAYCAAVVISLLNIPLGLSPDSPARAAGLEDLLTGLEGYVRRCQTYEGGISGKPDAEAHGAYAFCALGCLSILDAPHRIIPRALDAPRLISWLSARQYAPEAGFSGRTNKLVDGCYSHWVGACWPLLQASLVGSPGFFSSTASPFEHSFYDREGLIRYIMSCGQDHSPRGGMRDKPGRRSDAYHTCYVLSGLSSAQHIVSSATPQVEQVANVTWTVLPHPGDQVFDEGDLVEPTDPVYAIPQRSREQMMEYFLSKPGF
ncbi:putative Terpenoid cyclases/protein prenyltransferase alpha-alpha toroid [Seiridium unicorne]|uniref:Protein farnesyltransferase subunit beta n=1 Tax=Seiridium unicorne TaxID=138068 RepID=A0ABR2VBF6_9PEZI